MGRGFLDGRGDDRGRDVAGPTSRLRAASPVDATPLDAEHPLFIGYTSGTTGRPKGAVHVHGGFLVKIAEEVAYQVDLHRGERAALGRPTSAGSWARGRSSGALALGATVVLHRGRADSSGARPAVAAGRAPPHHVLGVSPTLDPGADRRRGSRLGRARPLVAADPRLDRRAVEPRLLPVAASRRSARRALPDHEPLGRHRGGRVLPVAAPGRADEARCRSAAPRSAWTSTSSTPTATPVAPGAVGELVCRQPWPSMTRGIWGDPERYLDTYWRRFPGVWVHGDWASRRRRRLLVPARPERRHAQRRRQAHRAGRDRVGGRRRTRRSPSRPPSACPTRSRASRSRAWSCVPTPGGGAGPRSRRSCGPPSREHLGKRVHARARGVRRRRCRRPAARRSCAGPCARR